MALHCEEKNTQETRRRQDGGAFTEVTTFGTVPKQTVPIYIKHRT